LSFSITQLLFMLLMPLTFLFDLHFEVLQVYCWLIIAILNLVTTTLYVFQSRQNYGKRKICTRWVRTPTGHCIYRYGGVLRMYCLQRLRDSKVHKQCKSTFITYFVSLPYILGVKLCNYYQLCVKAMHMVGRTCMSFALCEHTCASHVLVAFVEGILQGLFDEQPDAYGGVTKRLNASEHIRCPIPTLRGQYLTCRRTSCYLRTCTWG
jgi:hypothetical protein